MPPTHRDRLLLHVALAVALLPTTVRGKVGLHLAFSAECNSLFDWHSVGIFYSFEYARQHGNITRLLACSEEQLKSYPRAMLEVGPTFVHRNMRDDPLVDEVGYPSYNKPYSLMAWLEAGDIEEDYVLMLDGDMVLREDIDPEELGAAPGRVVSAEYTYLVGTEAERGFAVRFIAKRLVRRLAQVGGFHIFHKDDLRKIAPLWLEYTKQVRAFGHAEPDVFFRESMQLPPDTDEGTRQVRKKQAMWHSEMYGYVFAAAEVGVTHKVRRDVMLYPGYQPFMGRGPRVLHYGSDYTVDGAYFNKMMHTNLKLEECPKFLFNMPKTLTVPQYEQASARDGLCIEHLALMNAAFCRFYERHGCAADRVPDECVKGGVQRFTASARRAALSQNKCADEKEGCRHWAGSGECQRNPAYMHSSCARSCGSCNMTIDEILPDERWHGDWKHLARERGETIDDDGDDESGLAPPSPPSPPPPPNPPPPPPPPPHPSLTGLDAWIDDTPPPMHLHHPPPPPPRHGSDGGAAVGSEEEECIDAADDGAGHCRRFVADNLCTNLGRALHECKRSCNLCHEDTAKQLFDEELRRKQQAERGGAAAGGAGGAGGGAGGGADGVGNALAAGEDDISGYGHPATREQVERREALESSAALTTALLVLLLCGAALWGALSCWRRLVEPKEKLADKCAV